MPSDERTRLRIRQYLLEVMDEEAVNAMMESMAPIPWTDLATKHDLAQLESRLGVRLDTMDHRLDTMDERFTERFDLLTSGLHNEMVGLEGRLSLRFMEATRLIVFAVVLLMTGVIAAIVTVANIG